ncbi:MAG: STAS-like domain-containing protein [Alcanivoracaceae bacterium]
MKNKTINIALDFSRFPGGRFRSDGPASGEAFRDDHLVPAINNGGGGVTVISMDGVAGYGSSFLEEAFGGLIRLEHISEKDFWKSFSISASDSALLNEIKEYVHEAELNTRPQS